MHSCLLKFYLTVDQITHIDSIIVLFLLGQIMYLPFFEFIFVTQVYNEKWFYIITQSFSESRSLQTFLNSQTKNDIFLIYLE